MYAFSVSSEVTIVSQHGYRVLRAALPQDAGGGLDPAHVYLAIHDEDDLARTALQAQLGEGAPPAHAPIRRYREEDLQAWPGWPMRLGRLGPDRWVEGRLDVLETPAPLPSQLSLLRARCFGRRHFRIAIVGGFGFNLGDTLIGATAFRAALPLMRSVLSSVQIDVLLGPTAHRAIPELIGHEEGIGEVSFHSPTLQDFARYDAFFDVTGLVTLPRFHEMAALDWISWWFGLDPESTSTDAKRNRLRLPEGDVDWARGKLADRPGPLVAFVWRASTPLRSIPDEVAVRFARTLLEAAPDITLVTDRVLALDHPRLLDLGRETGSAERMMALVAQCDGLVSVDSLAPHVADAADVPALMLLASLPPSRFPYYPNISVVTPPGMEALPGWGVTKVPDDLWVSMRDAYADCWRAVSARDCWAMLAPRIAARAAPAHRRRLETGPPHDGAAVALPSPRQPFPHDRPGDFARWIDAEILRFARDVLVPGHTAVLASADSGDLTPALARAVAPGGALHVLEPRRLRAQKLVADVHAAGLASLHLLPAIAAAAAGSCRIADFDPAAEADPLTWGNCARMVEVAAAAIDGLRLDECRLLVLRPPQDVTAALQGARSLLGNARPLIVAGPVRADDIATMKSCLASHDYQGWASWPDRPRTNAALCLAAPREAGTRFDGFEPL